MPAPHPLPADLIGRPFTRQTALDAGVTSRMLQGRRFVRVYPGVWTTRPEELTDLGRIEAARLAAPPGSHVTGSSRLRMLGLEMGPVLPVHLVVARDLHRPVPDAFLHRTEVLPPTDDDGVIPTAAFIEFCREAVLIDAVAAGDWLLQHGHMTLLGLRELCRHDDWRAGAMQAAKASYLLDGRARSIPESRVRSYVVAAGLPAPESNPELVLGGRIVIPDLWWPAWRVAAEYEGSHHQFDRGQWLGDIDRYQTMRHHSARYVQVTKEFLRSPAVMVRRLYDELLRGGYDGPPPRTHGPRWEALHERIPSRPLGR